MENLIFGAFATLDGYREGDAANLGRTVYDLLHRGSAVQCQGAEPCLHGSPADERPGAGTIRRTVEKRRRGDLGLPLYRLPRPR